MTVVLEREGVAMSELLRSQLKGSAFFDGDPEYDERRAVWNGRYDRRPAAIVAPGDVEDVAAAVRFARANDLAVSAKGSGHGTAGWAVSDGGLTVDFSAWKRVEIDPIDRIARVQPGLTSGELDRATMEYGLAVPTGKVSSVGIAGLTLGGGIGWLSRAYGLTIDHLRSVQIVTGDGEIRTASEDEHPDLFWGVRGAGATLGLVTSFEFDLVPLSTVLAGFVAYPLERAPQLAQEFRRLSDTAPDALTMMLALVTMPGGPPMLLVAVTWCGDLAEGERLLEPVRSIGGAVVDMIAPVPYGALQAEMAKSAAPGLAHEVRAAYVDDCTDELILTLVDRYRAVPSGGSAIIYIELHGGAIARVADEATAFGHRAHRFNLYIDSGWVEPSLESAALAWLDETWSAVRAQTLPSAYINMLDIGDSHRAVEGYGAANYRRVLDLKALYDPKGIFRSNPVTPVLP